jgi:hypothetical protein
MDKRTKKIKIIIIVQFYLFLIQLRDKITDISFINIIPAINKRHIGLTIISKMKTFHNEWTTSSGESTSGV